MRWLARQAQNWVWESDNVAGTTWDKNCANVPVRADDLLLHTGRKLQGWHMGVASFFGDIGCIVANSAGLWSNTIGQTVFFEFAIKSSSLFQFNLYDPTSNLSHSVTVYNDLTKKTVNSFTSFDAVIYSYGIYEVEKAANEQQVYVAWMQVQSGYSVPNNHRRNLYIYPQGSVPVSSLSAANYGIFVGHVQVMDGLIDPRSVPWVVTSGAPVNVNSFDGVGLPDAVMLPAVDGSIIPSGNKIETNRLTLDGAQYRYRWAQYEGWKMSLTFANSSEVARINSWWRADTKLLYIDDTLMTINSVQIVNKEAPFSVYERPFLDRWKGSLELETY